MAAGPTFTFIQVMSTNGDGSGATNMNGNFSPGAPGFFFVENPPGFKITLHKLNIVIADNGAFPIEGFGAMAAPLTQGIELEQRFNGAVRLPLSGFRFRRNYEWSVAAGLAPMFDFSGNQNMMVIQSNFAPDFGAIIERSPGDYLGIRVRDNLTSLIAMIACVRGTITPL